MNEHETICDIIAEMRMFKCRNLETGALELCNAIGNYFADRLEAAIKREKAAIEADALAVGGVVEAGRRTPGNAAAMRDALEAARDLLLPQCNGGTAFAKACSKTVNKIMNALAAPPRNCDVMPLETARKVWFAKYIVPRLNGDLSLGKGVPFEEWFVAPATEKEGGTDGSK